MHLCSRFSRLIYTQERMAEKSLAQCSAGEYWGNKGRLPNPKRIHSAGWNCLDWQTYGKITGNHAHCVKYRSLSAKLFCLYRSSFLLILALNLASYSRTDPVPLTILFFKVYYTLWNTGPFCGLPSRLSCRFEIYI